MTDKTNTRRAKEYTFGITTVIGIIGIVSSIMFGWNKLQNRIIVLEVSIQTHIVTTNSIKTRHIADVTRITTTHTKEIQSLVDKVHQLEIQRAGDHP